jgi:hypothetical protein
MNGETKDVSAELVVRFAKPLSIFVQSATLVSTAKTAC